MLICLRCTKSCWKPAWSLRCAEIAAGKNISGSHRTSITQMRSCNARSNCFEPQQVIVHNSVFHFVDVVRLSLTLTFGGVMIVKQRPEPVRKAVTLDAALIGRR